MRLPPLRGQTRNENDNMSYYLLSSNPVDNMNIIYNKMLIEARSKNWISQKEYDYLVVCNPVFRVSYMLPKIHKDVFDLLSSTPHFGTHS